MEIVDFVKSLAIAPTANYVLFRRVKKWPMRSVDRIIGGVGTIFSTDVTFCACSRTTYSGD